MLNISYDEETAILAYIHDKDGKLTMKAKSIFSLSDTRAGLGFEQPKTEVEVKALRYHIAKELEEEYQDYKPYFEESSYKLLKNIPTEMHGIYVLAGDMQSLTCILIS